MGLHRQLPDRLRQLHPRYGTTWIGILVFGAIALRDADPGRGAVPGQHLRVRAMLSFTIAHLAVVRLRVKEPDHARPYRGPGTLRVAGRELPLFAVLGGMGTGLALGDGQPRCTSTSPSRASAGWRWACSSTVAYRKRQGLDLTSTKKVAIPQPVVEHEAEYDSVLVAFDVSHYEPDAVATGGQARRRRRRGIHVLVSIVVPSSSPIDARMDDKEREAQAIIEQAKLIGGRRVHRPRREGPRRPGGKADRRRGQGDAARAIVMELAPRSGGTLFEPTRWKPSSPSARAA